MSQKKRVLEYLEKNNSLDPLEAWLDLGVYRLAAVIHLLKSDGNKINSNRKSVKNKYNESCSVAVYSLVKPEQASFF